MSTNTNIKISEIISNRWSPRAFKNTAVEEEKLNRLFESARRAPSSFNEQPWRFILGVKGAGNSYEKILDSMTQFNQDWASLAPVLIVSVAKKTYSQNGNKNDASEYDTGQAVAYLTFQATIDGLHLHQMGGFDRQKIIESFNIPDDYEPQTIIALGYIGDPNLLPEEMRKIETSESPRIPLENLVFNENSNSNTIVF